MRRPTLPDNSTNERFKLASLTGVAVGGLLTSVLASPLSAAPSISQLSVRGLHAGATTVVTVDGGELLPDSKLVLPIPIAGQTMRSGATAQRVEWEVTLPAEVTPGIYSLRIANARGVSNAVPIGIDSLRQEPWAEEITALPTWDHIAHSPNCSIAKAQRLFNYQPGSDQSMHGTKSGGEHGGAYRGRFLTPP